ncbi:hypothetical protein [Rhodococcus pyridinivorans]|uniref:hypothetical protein n=1 Tax=Rhodococcus pyridinivorans TaxID=103816 RepID=UPI0026595463|nr:hypothetical protein [Rhodococcus pyridinivorans]
MRLARERIRWAATHKASSSDPDFDIHLDRLPAEQIKHVTVVVDHHHPTDHVQVLDRAAGSAAMVDGFYQGTLASVIDLKNFVAPPPEQRPVITKFAQSLAFVQGTRLLTTGMNRSQISHFEENVESFGIDVSPEFLTVLSDAIDTFDSGAGVLIERLGRSNQLAGSI